MLQIQKEKQEVVEFIKLFKSIPKESRRDIKFIIMGISLKNGINKTA